MAMKFFLLLFIQIFSTSSKAQSPQSNITQGSILYTNSTPNFWPSPSGHFAFRFYPSGNGFKVGIWFIDSPKNTIVWTFKRNDPVVTIGAIILFSNNGSLLLHSSTGQDQSIAATSQRGSVASMLDSGNFVLHGSNLEVVWASFDHPTDTLLVGQKLVEDNFLYSSMSETNNSIGNFRLWMQRDGNLGAYLIRSVNEGTNYWTSGTYGAGRNVSLNLAADSQLYLKNSTGFNIKKFSEGGLLVNESFIYRATFDVDGILRLYQHEIGDNGSMKSNILWEAIKAEDRCSVKGTCGLNSYCTINGANITCLCPPGFSFVDPKQANNGCKLNFNTESDCLEEKANEKYIITPLANTFWERDVYDILSPISEEACSEACLEDCNCVVAAFGNQMCFKHKLPLRYGKTNSSNPTKSLIKIRNETLNINTNVTKNLGKKFIVVGIVLAAFSLIVFMSSGYIVYTHHIWSYKIIARQAIQPDVIEDINLRSFSYDQIVAATNDFEEEIGRGASGKVFKGTLAANNGKEIAVKRLEKMVEDGENVFRNEMKIIGRTHHKNLVHLIGFCSEGSNRLLVYEFMKNGSLGNLLFNASNTSPAARLSWCEGMRIALEIAKGIQYLHEECETRIIHCDIKPHNILMDESWSAKISDFGLSKLLKPDQTRTYTIPRGTRGYVAPEWHNNNTPITVKADVYSYGVLLLEIICCRKNIDLTKDVILMDLVYRCYESGELEKLVNGEDVDMEELEKMVKIVLWCVQTELALRPIMKTVILMMEGIVVTPLRPSPSC